MKKQQTADRVLVGWKEYVDIPAWGIYDLKAKIDTGARTSAIHVEDIAYLTGGRVRFYVVLDTKKPGKKTKVIAHIVRRGRVTSSSGHRASRVFVAVDVKLGDMTRTIELSLVDRGDLTFRMLLGRTALDHRVLIDVHRAYVTKRARKRRRKLTR